jgi:hypothetical protein
MPSTTEKIRRVSPMRSDETIDQYLLRSAQEWSELKRNAIDLSIQNYNPIDEAIEHSSLYANV